MARKAGAKGKLTRGEGPRQNGAPATMRARKAAAKPKVRVRKLSPGEIAAFREAVYGHYREFKRDLPWRKTRDPYQILVSEMMLQQTQVSRVVPKFVEFVTRFPTARALASAPLGEVLETWAGLGYNRRAKMLWEAARCLVERHSGILPSTYELLRALPGIGDYTASAILAFAFGTGRPLIETNVRAVIIRHFFPRKKAVSEHEILALTAQTLDRENPREWYAAFMDYGAHLKASEGNHARRSAHHGKVKKAPFKGSMRQVRGEVLKEVITKRGKATAAGAARTVAAKLNVPRAQADAAVAGLIRDGLLKREGARVRVP
jgi:A/G-specific adenine glycosylase